MADRRVLDVLTGLDRAHHDFTGVHSDAHLQRRAALDAQAIGVAPHLLLHPERGVERALRMILMRDRRAEQREHAVAGRLHDVAAVAMRRVHHQRERRIDDRARFLGIEPLHQVHRALDVGEQRGDGLALALGRRIAIARRRGSVRISSGTAGRRSAKRRGALSTEFELRGIFGAALRADTN